MSSAKSLYRSVLGAGLATLTAGGIFMYSGWDTLQSPKTPKVIADYNAMDNELVRIVSSDLVGVERGTPEFSSQIENLEEIIIKRNALASSEEFRQGRLEERTLANDKEKKKTTLMIGCLMTLFGAIVSYGAVEVMRPRNYKK